MEKSGNRRRIKTGNTKLSLDEAVIQALSRPTELGRILSIIDVVRGYKSPFDDDEVGFQKNEGYKEAMSKLKQQRNKVKKLIKKHAKNHLK